MKLTFLGTRGYIEPKNPRHRLHTATLVSYRGRRVMIDCGGTWLGRLEKVTIFYVPDVVWIHDRSEAFAGIKVYGDGATLDKNFVREEKHSGKLIGENAGGPS